MSASATLTSGPRPVDVLDVPVAVDAPWDRARDRRSDDPVNRLSRLLGATVTNAVDAFEIAAAIEAYGIGDELARTRYGHDDVFSLATDIYERVPLRPRPRTVVAEEDLVGRRRLLRGALFALPGVMFVPLSRLATTRSAALVLIVVIVGGWAASQGIASMAHAQHTRAGRPAMLAVLRSSLIGGTALIVGVASGALVGGGPVAFTVAAGAQALYVLAAIVLFTLDRDLLIGRLLVPAVVLVAIAVGVAGLASAVAAAVVLAVVAVFAWVAFAATAGAAREGFHGRDVHRTVVLAVYGLLLGAVVAAPLAATIVRGDGVSTWLALAAVPVTLSMGVAERRFVAFRIAIREILHRVQHPGAYASAARRVFLRELAIYSATLAAITVCWVAAGTFLDPPRGADVTILAAYLVLGGGMFAGLVVTNAGRARSLLATLAGALVAFVVLGGRPMAFLAVTVAVSAVLVWTGVLTSVRVTGAR